ncbi:MAG: hypothetical protein KDA73_07300 [Rhodobacteraceae bacterium]|nr:hypothetical protein [Paracoccaceae bacterium]
MAVPTTKAPWHHWPVAVIALVFYVLAALDYSLAKLGVGLYLAHFSEAARSFINSMPLWLSLVWAVAVWGGLWGAWLLWSRNRFSVPLLFVGAAGTGFMTIWTSIFTRPTIFGMAGFTGFYLLVGSTAIAVLLYLYARWERAERHLG